MLTIYTDGSTRIKNQKGADNEGGFGYVVYDDGCIVDAYSEQVKNTTNNRMELMALLNVIRKYGTVYTWGCPQVYSDSIYAINCFTVWGPNWRKNNWTRSNGQTIENLDIIKEGVVLLESGDYNITIDHIKGHNGFIGNELADKLATGAITPEEVLQKYGQ